MRTGDDSQASELSSDQPDVVPRINALLRLVRSAREDPVPTVLTTAAETVRDAAGFGSVVVNLYRPAWDDYEAVLVVGADEVRELLLGSTVARAALDGQLIAGGYERVRGVYFLPGDAEIWNHIDYAYVPDLDPLDHPEAWQPDDGLVVRLTDSAGRPLGVLSVDEPVTGLRPDDADLQLLRAISSHAEQALEQAETMRRHSDTERMLAHLLSVSPTLTSHATPTGLLSAVASTIVPELGFERVALYLRSEADALELVASRGWGGEDGVAAPALAAESVEALLAGAIEEAGCWLVPARAVDPSRPPGWASARSGRGPAAWHDDALVLPVRGDDGYLHALAVIEDPVDGLRPTTSLRRTMRLLLDQASSALQIIAQRERLRFLADHDPLTGVRNRRDLPEMINGMRAVALVVCDLDHFKAVNDRYGHEAGDRVLESVGALLRELARDGDLAVRLGGEEFCLVLPGTDAAGAMAVGERLRRETARRVEAMLGVGVTMSVGVAAATGPVAAEELLAEADRALYAAKRAGRDRTVASGE